MLADWIGPDIAGDRLQRFWGTEDVFVVAHFPEAAAGGLAKVVGGAEFEVAEEFAEVGSCFGALGEEVKVVGHQAIGVK